MSRYFVATMSTIYMKSNVYNKLQNFFKNLTANIIFLSDEKYKMS
jgi:hypothetical protein